jgi:uncharacterized protein YraI
MRIQRLVIILLAIIIVMGFLASGQGVEAQESLNIVIINAAAVHLRTGPGAQYASLGILHGGANYTVTGISPDRIWFYIIGTAFGNGWVRGQFTIFRGDIGSVPIISTGYGALSQATFVVNVRIYAYNRPNGVVIGILRGGREFLVTGRNYEGGWLRIQTPEFGEVWVIYDVGDFRGTYRNVPLIENAAVAPDLPDLPYLVVNVEALNLRSGPGVQYAVLGILEGGDSYPILNMSEDRIWFYIGGTPFGAGWVRGRHTIFRGDIRGVSAQNEPIGALAPSRFFVHIFIPVFDRPGGRQLGLLPGQAEYSVTGRSRDAVWIRLSTPQFGTVWTQTTRGSFRGFWPNVLVVN